MVLCYNGDDITRCDGTANRTSPTGSETRYKTSYSDPVPLDPLLVCLRIIGSMPPKVNLYSSK
jgi:hypothetical protein